MSVQVKVEVKEESDSKHQVAKIKQSLFKL